MTNKELILQYVDTGLILPEYQVNKLPSWAIKTYIRKRIIARSRSPYRYAFREYEFYRANDEQKEEMKIGRAHV